MANTNTKDLEHAPQRRKLSISSPTIPAKRTRKGTYSANIQESAGGTQLLAECDLPSNLKTSHACLDSLSEEVVLNICKYLREGALAALSQTNKRYNRIANELLYCHITTIRRGSRKKAILLRILARDAALSSHVKSIDIDFRMPVFRDIESRARFNKLTYDGDKQQRQDFAAILKNASNLHSLLLSDEKICGYGLVRLGLAEKFGWLKTFREATTDALNQPAVRFTKLRELTIDTEHLSIEELSFAFRIPSLQKLCLDRVYQPECIEWDVEESSCNVNELAINCAFVCSEAVAQILSVMKALSKFSFSFSHSIFGPFEPEENPNCMWAKHNYSLIGSALQKHKDSLVDLLVMDYIDMELLASFDSQDLDLGTLGTLEDFHKLRILDVPMWSVLDANNNGKDLSIMLPHRLQRFSTTLEPSKGVTEQSYAQALASLKNIEWAGLDSEICLFVDPGLLLGHLPLSRALEDLPAVYVDIRLIDDNVPEGLPYRGGQY